MHNLNKKVFQKKLPLSKTSSQEGVYGLGVLGELFKGYLDKELVGFMKGGGKGVVWGNYFK